MSTRWERRAPDKNNASYAYFTSNTQKRAQPICLPFTDTLESINYISDKQGSPSADVTFRIETESAGLPSGTLAWTNASGSYTDPADGQRTVSLTASGQITRGSANQVWLVAGTTAADGSNGYGLARHTDELDNSDRYYNGSAWSNPATGDGFLYQLNFASGRKYGPMATSYTYIEIYGSTRKGKFVYRPPAPGILEGFELFLGKSGTPTGMLRIEFLEDTSVLETIDTSLPLTGLALQMFLFYFASPRLLRTDKDYTWRFSMHDASGNSSNLHRVYRNVYNSGTEDSYIIPARRFLPYSSTDGTNYTLQTGEGRLGLIWSTEGLLTSPQMQVSMDSTIRRGGSGQSLRLNWPLIHEGRYTLFYPVNASEARTIALYMTAAAVPASAGVQPQLVIPVQSEIGISEAQTATASIAATGNDGWVQVTLPEVTPNAAGVMRVEVNVRETNNAVYVDESSG